MFPSPASKLDGEEEEEEEQEKEEGGWKRKGGNPRVPNGGGAGKSAASRINHALFREGRAGPADGGPRPVSRPMPPGRGRIGRKSTALR